MKANTDYYRSSLHPSEGLLFDDGNWYRMHGEWPQGEGRIEPIPIKSSEARRWLQENGHKAA